MKDYSVSKIFFDGRKEAKNPSSIPAIGLRREVCSRTAPVRSVARALGF